MGAEVEAKQELEDLLFLLDFDPILHEPRVLSQNETLTYLVDEGEGVKAGVLSGKIPPVAVEISLDRWNSNPDAEWILGEPWVRVRSGSDQVQSSSSALVGLGKPARRECPGRNRDPVSNPGQGDALQEVARTTLLPPRMTESSDGRLLLPAARRHPQPCPTDPHSLPTYPNCGSGQGSTVCW